MEIAKVLVYSTSGVAESRNRIPAGAVGLTVSVVFADPVWERLAKTVVFRGACSKIAEFDGKKAVIPWEVMALPDTRLYFGIYGTDQETGLQLPLIEVPIGATERASNPNADPGTDPTLPIWAQLQEDVEDLKQSGGPGEPGADGFSPVASVEQTESGAVITITDKTGTTTAVVSNGKDGAVGPAGPQGPVGPQGPAGDPGGSSATPDWNAAEGEPGHILNKPFGSTFEEGTVLAECSPEGTSGEFMLPDIITLTVGKEYTINWNGVQYKCIAKDFPAFAPGAVAIGNEGFIENSTPTEGGEPFVVVALPADKVDSFGGNGVLIAAFDMSESVTLSITGMVETITPVPDKYIGSVLLYAGANNYLYKTKDTSNRENALLTMELKSIVNSGKAIYLHGYNVDGMEMYQTVYLIGFGTVGDGIGAAVGYVSAEDSRNLIHRECYVANSPSDIP